MFYEARKFPFVERLEQHVEKIRCELERFIGGRAANRQDCQWIPLSLEDRDLHRTAALLLEIAGCQDARFVRLSGGQTVWPRRDENRFLRCLLAVSGAFDGQITVAGERRPYRSGQCVVMNADCVHEVWSKNDSEQWMLQFDVDPRVLRRPLAEYAAARSWSAWFLEPLQYVRYLLRKMRPA